MATEPIDLQIMLNFRTAIRNIREDAAAPYYNTVRGDAVKLDPNTDAQKLVDPNGPRPFVILELSTDRRQYFPSDEMKVTLPVRVHWVSGSVPSDDESRLRVFLRASADVERAMRVDASLGGLAMETLMVRRTLDSIGDGTLVWALFDIEIPFYRTHGEP